MLEPARGTHAFIEDRFARMAERGMPHVVQECDGFGQIFVEAQGAGDGSADLGDFEGVRQAGAMIIAKLVDEHLRLVHEPAERGGMDNAIAVALIDGAK